MFLNLSLTLASSPQIRQCEICFGAKKKLCLEQKRLGAPCRGQIMAIHIQGVCVIYVSLEYSCKHKCDHCSWLSSNRAKTPHVLSYSFISIEHMEIEVQYIPLDKTLLQSQLDNAVLELGQLLRQRSSLFPSSMLP